MAKSLMKIENVYFAYVVMDAPKKNKFDSSGLQKEFSAVIVLNKEQRKYFRDQKLNKTVKEIDTAQFEDKYKFAAPYPDQDEQYFLTVTKKATHPDGNLKPEWTFPKVYFKKDESIILENKTKVGNGSFGDVRLELSFNDKLNQTNVILDSILVKDHVEYSSGDEWASAAGVETFVQPEPRAQSFDSSSNQTPFNSKDLDDDLPF